jgi:hypothetical protein
VTQNVQNIDLLSPEIDVSNQPASVVTDIENDARTDFIGIAPALSYIWKMLPHCFLGYSVPCG